MKWPVQSRYYSSAATAALAYQAEALTPLGGATVAVGAPGASGGGANDVVRQGTHMSPRYGFSAPHGKQALLAAEVERCLRDVCLMRVTHAPG